MDLSAIGRLLCTLQFHLTLAVIDLGGSIRVRVGNPPAGHLRICATSVQVLDFTIAAAREREIE